ncbi:MAG: LysR family transcriptional regulator, partial [Humibacillus sp.]|nr:LysR family transcriptional regulator [Humibacillus sp.]
MADPTEPLRVDFVLGVTPDKWARTWAERHPETPLVLTPVDAAAAEARLRDGVSALSLLRLPVHRAGLHVIALYEEQPVAIVAKDHAAAAFDELDIADLADELLLQPADSVPAWRDAAPAHVRASAAALGPLTTVEAVAVVAAGSGFVVVPLSVARALHRKDVVHRPLTGLTGV